MALDLSLSSLRRAPDASPRARTEPVSSWLWLAVAGATLVAAALRFPFLNHASLWFDETYTRSIMAEPTLSGLWHHVRATESTPPLYYLLSWLINAHSATAMRLLPAVSLVLAVPVGFLAFRRLIGPVGAAATAWLLAVNPFLVSYSMDARAYGLLVLTGLLSVWAFARLLHDGSWTAHLLWALAGVACIWSHYFGGFLFAAEGLVLLAARPGQRARTLAVAGLTALLVAPLVFLVTQQTGDRSAYIAGMSLSSRLKTTVRQFGMGPNVPRSWLEAAGLLVWWVGVAAGGVLALRRAGPGRMLVGLIAISLGVPLLLGVAGVIDRFDDRNVITAVPLLAALAAPALLRLRAVPLAAYLVLAALTSIWVATDWRYEQADWRNAIEFILRTNGRDPVMAVTSTGRPVASVYLGRGPASGAVRTRTLWLVVEPIRGAHDRAEVTAPVPAVPGFTVSRRWVDEAFVLELLRAPRPQVVRSGLPPGTVVFPGASGTAG